jgi:hypothetical protein
MCRWAILVAAGLCLSSCSTSTNLPLGGNRSPDARKLNSEMSGKEVWINDEEKVEKPVTVRFALDSFFTRSAGAPEQSQSYLGLKSITFRYHAEGGKRGAIGGAVIGAFGGFIAQYDQSRNLKPGETGNYVAEYGPYLGALAGAGIGYAIGYVIGAEYTYRIVR